MCQELKPATTVEIQTSFSKDLEEAIQLAHTVEVEDYRDLRKVHRLNLLIRDANARINEIAHRLAGNQPPLFGERTQ